MGPEQNKWMENIYRQYFHDLFLYALVFVRKKDLAEEIIQDTFHEASKDKNIEKLMSSEEPFKWLKKTVWNKCQEAKRFQMNMLTKLVALDENLVENACFSDPTADSVGRMTEQDILKRLKDVLTPDEFHILMRIAVQKATHLDVAQELGISVSASQKRLERIRKKLESEFPDYKPKK